MPIGVFDSGLGGLTVLKALLAAMPDQEFLYYGDNANAPIGVRSQTEITDITRDAVQVLFDQGCSLVILACNTASAVALRPLQEYWVPADRRVLGVFVPMIEVVTGRDWADRRPPMPSALKRVAFFATPATVSSGAFRREVAIRATDVDIASVACPGLVDALERGDQDATTEYVQSYVAQLLCDMPSPEVTILGCTHYPLAEPIFRAALPDGAEILSQGGIVAASLKDYLRRRPEFVALGKTRYLTSGDPKSVSEGAVQLLGERLDFQGI